jgi:hypothetical protein
MEHLAEYIKSRYNWIDFYSSRNQKEIPTSSKYDPSSLVTQLSLVVVMLLVLFGQNYWLETIAIVGGVQYQRFFSLVLGVLGIWIINYILGKISEKKTTKLINEWYDINKDNWRKFSNLDKEILLNRGLI